MLSLSPLFDFPVHLHPELIKKKNAFPGDMDQSRECLPRIVFIAVGFLVVVVAFP